MATFDTPNLDLQKVYTTPHGNQSVHAVRHAQSANLAVNDKIRLAPLPQGLRIYDISVVVRDAANSGTTFDLGPEQEGSGDFTDDADYFLDGSALSAVGHFSSRATRRHLPLTIEDPNVHLVLTVRQATTNNFEVDVLIRYEFVGTP